MCGIFGYISGPKSTFDTRASGTLVKQLFLLSESRGKDASGLLLLNDTNMTVVKRPVRARELLNDRDYRTTIHGFESRVRRPGETVGFLGHARMVTNGSEETHENNQPVLAHGLCALHNGIIVNEAALWQKAPTVSRKYEVDTEVLLGLIAHYRNSRIGLPEAFRRAFCDLQGANSFAFISPDVDALILATSNGSLYFAANPAGHDLMFASERYFLEKAIAHRAVRSQFAQAAITHIQPGEGRLFRFPELRPQDLMLTNAAEDDSTELGMRIVSRTVIDLRSQQPSQQANVPQVKAAALSDNDRFIQRVNDAVDHLRRCTTCILPETFPGIQFDEDGVCNYCRGYKPLIFQGAEALAAVVEPYRRSDGRPDCLVPISGGRDSCYGLHYVKQILGMNPVAYTYDWGMVTDLARRNISRMCGALGVEHILLSADIRTKRKYIRQNVQAWLKHPVLGTVPLFMAGDKQFFYFAQMLRKQMNIDLLMFSFNWLERTDFKAAFAKVERRQDMPKLLTNRNLVEMAGYYAAEYVRNPAYINSSIWDTLFAFFSFYLIPRHYETIYEYIRWDESEISNELVNKYGWETAKDTPGTWRIGDGTASFYNYIYYTMAGFSENDTFRSNQIREGMLSRENAVRLAEEENQPRYQSIKWYCDTAGISMPDALRVINAAPKVIQLEEALGEFDASWHRG